MVVKSKKNKIKSKQHIYYMRGCAKKANNKSHFFSESRKCKCVCHLNKNHSPNCKCKCHHSKQMFGGDALNLSLAYTGTNVSPLQPSPHASYSGGNLNALYPNQGGIENKNYTDWINSSRTIRGGMSGGSPALIGSPWTANSDSWPGVSGNSNHYPLNTYSPNDIQLQQKMLGASPPFMGGGRRRLVKTRTLKKNCKIQKGGNIFPSSLLNVGNVMYNLNKGGNAYNGYPPPVNPLPYEGHLLQDNFYKYFK